MLRAQAPEFRPHRKINSNVGAVKVPDAKDPVRIEESKLPLADRVIRRPEKDYINKVKTDGYLSKA